MDAGLEAEDNVVSRVDSYLTYTYAFRDNPTAMVDLFQLTTEHLRQRAIRGFDDYEFYFRIFNDPTGSVTWRTNSKFMINMPSDYIVSPTVQKVNEEFTSDYVLIAYQAKWYDEEEFEEK